MTIEGNQLIGEGPAFSTFLDSLFEPGTAANLISPNRFMAALAIDVQTLAAQVKVHDHNILHAPESDAIQRFLRQAACVIQAAADLSGDLNKALFWYRHRPLPPFKFKTAEQLVVDGRADAVVQYISMLEAGAAG